MEFYDNFDRFFLFRFSTFALLLEWEEIMNGRSIVDIHLVTHLESITITAVPETEARSQRICSEIEKPNVALNERGRFKGEQTVFPSPQSKSSDEQLASHKEK